MDLRNAKQDLPPLRCATAGSVDDGKSTLIGRLLFDAKALHTDQLAHLSEWSERRGLRERDLALVTDGLRAEREQGITIDVAWRYFATANRRFILADSPGHVQYTRNMVTAASHADVAIILVDARRGMTEQTRRHLFIARLLGTRGITIAVNKMDQVGYALDVFASVRDDVTDFLRKIDLPRPAPELAFVPVSALRGDNVVDASTVMPWYDGPPLLAQLEAAPLAHERADAPPRLFVQCVIRARGGSPDDFRGVAGQIASGSFRPGDVVRILPSDVPAIIRSVETADGPLDVAQAGASVTLRLTTELDVGRGDLIVGDDARGDGPIGTPPTLARDLRADIAWVQRTPSRAGAAYLLKLGTREVRAQIDVVEALYDVASAADVAAGDRPLAQNDLARVKIRTSEVIAFDPYAVSRVTGGFLLLDPATGDTLAAGMIRARATDR